MTAPIPERPRTLVGSHPNRQPLEGREAVERAIRFCRCRPHTRRMRNAADWTHPAPGDSRPFHEDEPEGWQDWLGDAAGLNLDELETLLDNGFVLHEGRLLVLQGDALVSVELQLSPDEPAGNAGRCAPMTRPGPSD